MKMTRLIAVSKVATPVLLAPPSEPPAPRAIMAPAPFAPEFTAYNQSWFVDIEEYFSNNPSPSVLTVGAVGRSAQEAWSYAAGRLLESLTKWPFVDSAVLIYKGARVKAARAWDKYPAGLPQLPNAMHYKRDAALDLSIYPKAKALRIPILSKR